MEHSHTSKKGVEASDKIVDSACRLLANLCRSAAGCGAVLDKEGLVEKLIMEVRMVASHRK